MEAREVLIARNFLMLKVGNEEPQLISQVNWGYTIAAEFTKSQMTAPHYNTKRNMGADICLPIPSIGVTMSSGTPKDQPITANRYSDAALRFFGNNSNWTATGPPDSIAHKYSRNP